MKFCILSILLSITIIVSVRSNEPHYNMNMITGVHHRYKATGVILVSGTDHSPFERITIWHETVRMLSYEGISTLIINFKKFKDKLKVGNKITGSLLIVIDIGTMEEFHTFESIVKNVDLNYGISLILFARDASQEVCDFCRNSHGSLPKPKFGTKVLISCCESNMIEEWSLIGDNRTRNLELGRLMDGNHGIEWLPNELVNSHRYSLDGRGLRIAGIMNSVEFPRQVGVYYGLLGEFLKELIFAMNFTVSEIIWEDYYGTRNSETSTWSGVVGRIYRREADLGVAFFAMTSERYDAVSFTAPIAIHAFQLHYRKHDVAHIEWNAYFKGLTVDVWIALMGLILTTPIFLTIISYKRRSHFLPLLFEHYLYVWGIFCQQGVPEFPNELPSRIVYSSISLSALVTSAAYSAAIISSLATPSYPLFDSIEKLVEDGSYKFIMVKNSAAVNMHQFADQTIENKWISLLKPNDSMPQTILEGYEQVCSERVAFYSSELSKKILNSAIPCEITSLNTGRIQNVAMIMPRGSEYLDFINHHIHQLRANGILDRIIKKYTMGLYRDKHEHASVALQTVTPILLILSFGFLIAVIKFIIEKHSYSSTKNSEILLRRRNQDRLKNLRTHFRF